MIMCTMWAGENAAVKHVACAFTCACACACAGESAAVEHVADDEEGLTEAEADAGWLALGGAVRGRKKR